MSKPLPLQHSITYHIYNRGTNGENLFRNERNYNYFLTLYSKYVSPFAVTYAYCLLANHFHLLVRIKEPDAKGLPRDPSQNFSNLFNAYTKAFNKVYTRTGSLFEHPFHRIAITNDAYFLNLVHYIHRNPQKHGFVQDFREYPYSSYQPLTSKRPTYLDRADVLTRFNGIVGFHQFHSQPQEERPVLDLIGDDFA